MITYQAIVEARRRIVTDAVAHLPGVTVDLRSYRGDVSPEDVHPLDLVPAGIPFMFLLDMMKKHIGENVGHIDFSPAIPFDGESAAKHELMVRTILEEAGLVAGFGWIANTRSLVGACMVFFDVNDPAEAAAAHAAVDLMCEKAAEWGNAETTRYVTLLGKLDARKPISYRIDAGLLTGAQPVGIRARPPWKGVSQKRKE